MKKKKIIINAVLTTLTMLICIFFTHNSSLRYGNVIFNMNDEKGDDYGAGKIMYPENYKDYKGIFDITNFKVKDEKNEMAFEYTLFDINNDYNNDNGFSNIIIDTYINVDDEGLTTTLEYGAAVTFNEDFPWKYHIRITPEEYYIEKLTDRINRTTEKLQCSLTVHDKTIIIRTPKENIEFNLKESKYYVFTGGYDIFASDNYRQVNEKGDEWTFGGGIDSVYQPNVLDVVSPIQSKMLIYFMPPMFAMLSPVYNQAHQILFKKELLYILIFIFFTWKYINIYKTTVKYIKRKKDDTN